MKFIIAFYFPLPITMWGLRAATLPSKSSFAIACPVQVQGDRHI